jgi:Na+-translocating ferredoxin:NAD+ oxidoreductase RnfC subunit
MMNVSEAIRNAGVVGAGGAGFPVHIKAGSKAEIVLANGAECEPLLNVDKIIMQHHPDKIVRGIKALMEAVDAKEGVICVKKKNQKAISALKRVLVGESMLRMFELDNYYPAGDEQQIVYEVTGKVVPTGGIPLDVGAVVSNVTTLANIADALDGIPVTDKYVTVAGEVRKPMTLKAPIGTPFEVLVREAQGPQSLNGYAMIVGGPATGRISGNLQETVQKTTGGIIILKKDHPLISKKTGNKAMDIKLAKAACCQCNLCTMLCPRNALGLGVEPHKAMRAAFTGKGNLLGDPNGIFSCCDCGICTYYACNFGLSPSRMMVRMKQGLIEGGVKPEKKVKGRVIPGFSKIPTYRLMARMGITQYDVEMPLGENLIVSTVRIPLRMHIGKPSVPVVKMGDAVKKGQLLAEIPEASLGARVHASISGKVSAVTNEYIEIKA